MPQAALPMDIQYIRGDLYNLGYRFKDNADTDIALSLYGSDLCHGMTNYDLRQPPAPGNWRRNKAKSDNAGFKLQATLRDMDGEWRVGVDGFDSKHESNIDNPNNPMFFVVNFHSAEREVLGAFVEHHDVARQCQQRPAQPA